MTHRRAVLFDLYGTLVAPDWPMLSAGRAALARRVGIDPDLALRAWADTHRTRMLGGYGSLEQDLAAVFALARGSATPSTTVDASLLSELADEERVNWRRAVRLYADVPAEIGRLRAAGFGLAIVTDASAEAASVLYELGLDRAVDLTLASCDARSVKPELLDIAVERLGVEPSDITLVDDQPATVAAADERGMRAVLIRRPDAPVADPAASAPGQVIADLGELSALLLGAPPPLRR